MGMSQALKCDITQQRSSLFCRATCVFLSHANLHHTMTYYVYLGSAIEAFSLQLPVILPDVVYTGVPKNVPNFDALF